MVCSIPHIIAYIHITPTRLLRGVMRRHLPPHTFCTYDVNLIRAPADNKYMKSGNPRSPMRFITAPPLPVARVHSKNRRAGRKDTNPDRAGKILREKQKSHPSNMNTNPLEWKPPFSGSNRRWWCGGPFYPAVNGLSLCSPGGADEPMTLHPM